MKTVYGESLAHHHLPIPDSAQFGFEFESESEFDDDGMITAEDIVQTYLDDVDIEIALEAVRAQADRSAQPSLRPPSIELCTGESLQRLSDSARNRPLGDDLAVRDRAIVKMLRSSDEGRSRKLKTLGPHWRADIDALERDYSNFSALFAYVRSMCALAELSDGAVVLDPMLLQGQAGCGKSTVVEELANIVAGGFRRLAMSSAETGAQIGGSASSWSNSSVGTVFDLLVNGAWANPLILLDEIDRSATDSRFSPIGPLYQLLEPAMSSTFQDLSVPLLSINASRVMWMATSNDCTRVPEPIRQRMEQFDVPYPTHSQGLAVARSVLSRLARAEPVISSFYMTPDAVDLLSKHPPRVMRRLLRIACGNAALQDRHDLRSEDFSTTTTASRASAIGFLG